MMPNRGREGVSTGNDDQVPFALTLLPNLSHPSDTTFLVDEAENSLCGDAVNLDRMGSSAFLKGVIKKSMILVSNDGDVDIQTSVILNSAEEAEGLGNANQSMARTRESSLSSKGVDALEARRLFLKGMEEANKFLPKGDSLLDRMPGGSGNFRGCRNRHDRCKLEEAGSASKLMMAKEEDDDAREMHDETMPSGYRLCNQEIDEPRIAMNNNKKKKKGVQRMEMVDLRALLMHCAQAVAADDRHGACVLLEQIRRYASPTGDAIQRLAFCFAEGLEARLVGTGRQFLMAKRISAVEFLKAYQLLMEICPVHRVAFAFSSMAVCDALSLAPAGRSRLHIVDYGTNKFQWLDLLHRLAKREGGPPEVKITVIDHVPQPGFLPDERIEEAGRHLRRCAFELGLPLKFHAIVAKFETICVEDLNIEPDEVLVVNDLLKFSRLMDESVVPDRASPRDVVLGIIRDMRPHVFIQGIVNSLSGTFFFTRFPTVLSYFLALFDMLDATTQRQSYQRRVLEQGMLGGCALNAIACEDADRMDHPENYRRWQARNQRAGLRQLPLNPEVVKTVRAKVNAMYHKDFLIDQDGQWLLQGWKGRILYSHSLWVAQDPSPHR